MDYFFENFFWLTVIIIGLLPFVLLLYKKNYKTFILLVVLPYLLVFLYNSYVCLQKSTSEACVWGYILYIYLALFTIITYSIVSISQIIYRYISKIRDKHE